MEVYASIWTYMEVYAGIWRHSKVYQSIWRYIEVYGLAPGAPAAAAAADGLVPSNWAGQGIRISLVK